MLFFEVTGVPSDCGGATPVIARFFFESGETCSYSFDGEVYLGGGICGILDESYLWEGRREVGEMADKRLYV